MGKYLGPNGLSYLWSKIKSHFAKSTYDATLNTNGAADKAVSIPFAAVDSTSTSTAFTATVDGITELRDGVCCYIKNGVVTSAAGCTLDINGLGAKPIYQTMAAATATTTAFNVNYTMLFIYNSSRVSGGCWDMYYGFYSDSNSTGYDIREYYNGSKKPKTVLYRYQFLFSCKDGLLLPANTDDNVTAATHTLTTESFNPFGEIYYYGSISTLSANGNIAAAVLHSQLTYSFADLRYSFNTASTLTAGNDVYLVCVPQNDGQVKLAPNPIAFHLPITEDGLVYKRLGKCYDTYRIILEQHKPCYCYKDGAIRQWTNPEQNITEGVYVEDEWNKKNSTRTGDTEIKKVDGKTVVWNQILDYRQSTQSNNGVYATYSSTTDSFTVGGTTTAGANLQMWNSRFSLKKGHKYLFNFGALLSDTTNNGRIYIYDSDLAELAIQIPFDNRTYSEYQFFTPTKDYLCSYYINVGSSGVTISGTITPRVYDLTQMFGTGNEPTSVEEFEKLFPLDSYSYDAGRIINVAPTAIKSTDAGGSDLDQVALPITTLTGKPTGSSTSEIIFPNGMNGIGNVKDEIDFVNGRAVKRIERVDMGSLTWRKGTVSGVSFSVDFYSSGLSTLAKSNTYGNVEKLLSDRYLSVPSYALNTSGKGLDSFDKSILLHHGSTKILYVRDDTNASLSASEYKTAMNGVYLYYELATPIEYTLDTLTLDKYKAEAGGTETILPYGGAAPTIAPVKIGLEYKASYQEKLVSGTNIKTINNESILGSGNITIQGGGGSGEENVIEIVKVNNTALTPDADKAVNIDLTDYNKKPLIIDIDESQTSVTSGTYASITAALAAERDVALRASYLIYRYNSSDSNDGWHLFSACDGEELYVGSIYIYSDDSLELLGSGVASANHYHGNLAPTGTLQTNDISIANGDKLVITDSSDSNKIARASISFDGSTTTQALSKKGTWETFAKQDTQKTLITLYSLDSDGTNPVFKDADGNTITNTAVKTLLEDKSKDVVILYDSYVYILQYYTEGTWGYHCFEGDGATFYLIELGVENDAISTVSCNEVYFANNNHVHGNIKSNGTLQTNDISIANGDKLVVTDSSSSSKVARTSVTFDGSTTSKALTQKGTWETFSTTSPGTLNTTATTAQSTSASEALSGSVTLHKVAKTGTYSDLIGTPAAVTETTVSNWGFTKNTGTYSKPSGGIPKTDLESAVQTSLGLADTALQSFTETDPTVPSWAKASSKPTYTASEVGALSSSTTYVSTVNGSSGAVTITPGDVNVIEAITFNGTAATITSKTAAITASIPTKVSDLTNDTGFISNASVVTIYSGSTTPSSSLGNNGDIYVKTS